MNTTAFLGPQFKSLAHLSKESIDSVIENVGDKVGELMKLNVNRADENDYESPKYPLLM